eukprot:1444302-Prymnesium_polylepis.1
MGREERGLHGFQLFQEHELSAPYSVSVDFHQLRFSPPVIHTARGGARHAPNRPRAAGRCAAARS